ncbi:endonuclease III-like protein 1 isoform X1 [Argiope bruennichi]|uniref:endonuclease III-like protein 1 isoform X1 n=1 Tax=Argiope bruennichi TaxID=94029 RepID=UPI002494DD9B|nr:endonuclease III-like protein 1 isoform X1 [Argiope bruennichi]XP_055940926.1 endonuclease III-like protein 1 isoform X1 [Argiope bruennichi]
MQIFSKSLRNLQLLKLSVRSITFTEIMNDRKINASSLRTRSVVKNKVSATTDSVENDTDSDSSGPVKLFSVVRQIKPSLHREISKDGKPRQVRKQSRIRIYCDDDDEEEEVPQQKNNNKSPRKRKQTENETVKGRKAIKTGTEKQAIQDIEDIWQPENWRVVLDNIQKMRKMYKAPVDSLGCEECPEKNVSPKVYRYQTLISVMLSSQTRDEVTFAATERLIEHGLTMESILATPDEKIKDLIHPVGFCKSKVRYIKKATQMIKDQFNGDIPKTFVDLLKLPGVGPKIANLVMSVAWKKTVGIAVDTHVHRISNRLGWVPKPTKEPEQTRKALEKWLPKEEWRPINLTLVGFGQTICRPVGPHCAKCLNSELCPFGKSVLSGKNKKKKQLK